MRGEVVLVCFHFMASREPFARDVGDGDDPLLLVSL